MNGERKERKVGGEKEGKREDRKRGWRKEV